ncbi:MAG: hypothetical protein AB3N11_13735 [Arenibacterium sp.]
MDLFGYLRRALVLLATFMVLSTSALAQAGFITGAVASGDSPQSGLADAIREGADAGVRGIILESPSHILSTGGTSDTKDSTANAMEGSSSLMRAQSQLSEFRETLKERLTALPGSFAEVAYILRATSPDGTIWTYVKVVGWSAFFFLISRFLTTEIYGKRLVRRYVVGRIVETPQGYREKMPFLVFRFVMGIGGTVFSMIVAYTIGTLMFGGVDDISVQFTITAIFALYFIARTVSDLWRMILSPFLPQYRIPNFSDRDSKRLYYWASTVAALDIASIMFSTWIFDFGLNYNVYAILYGLASLVVLLLNIAMVLFNRRAITEAIRNGREQRQLSWLVRTVSVAWAPLVIGYFIFGWLKLAFDLVLERPVSIPLIAGAYAVLISIIVVYGVINYLIERYFDRRIARDRMNSEMAAADADEDRMLEADILPPEQEVVYEPSITTYEQLARRVAGILAFVAGSYAMLRIWDPENLVLDQSLAGRALGVIVILFIGYIVYHFFRILIGSKNAE